MEAFLFYGGGLLLLLGGILMVTSRSAVNAACWLVLAFLGSSALFASLHAPFLAVLQVLVYAGAIMVLFLFVIMMLEGPVLPAEGKRPKVAVGLLAALPVAVIFALVARRLLALPEHGFTAVAAPGFGQPVAVARLLLGKYLLAFELISVVLVVAIIGALALGRLERSKPWK
ncbi:MAG: NADH-quinone oxidoreductase subunit J [Candidatus Krumholzibacteriia bacterium]